MGLTEWVETRAPRAARQSCCTSALSVRPARLCHPAASGCKCSCEKGKGGAFSCHTASDNQKSHYSVAYAR